MTGIGGSPYDGLEPGTWRALLARAALYYAMRTKLAELCDHLEQSRYVQDVMRDLEMQASECAANDIDDEETVQRVIEAWDVRLTTLLGMQSLDPTARKLIGTLRELSRSAHGTDPFQEMFAGIAEHARNLYGSGWRTPTLGLAPLMGHPRPGRDPYVATAATPWPPQDLSAEVELRIYCDGFGPAAFAVLPMLLAHECICHVPARQDKAANDSWFAEGLMDWTAYFYYANWAVKLDHGLAPAAQRHVDLLRALLTNARSFEGDARRGGHFAAHTLQAWFQRECDLPKAEAELKVAELAVQLNLIDRPLSDKDRFVSLVGQPLPPGLEAALRSWASAELPAGALLDVAA